MFSRPAAAASRSAVAHSFGVKEDGVWMTFRILTQNAAGKMGTQLLPSYPRQQ